MPYRFSAAKSGTQGDSAAVPAAAPSSLAVLGDLLGHHVTAAAAVVAVGVGFALLPAGEA